MSSHRFDPEFYTASKAVLEAPRLPAFKDALEVRSFSTAFLHAINDAVPPSNGIEQKTFSIESYDGAKIALMRFASQAAINSATPLPAVIFIHGGGMVSGSAEIYTPQTSYLAQQTGFSVFSVDYRVAPEHPAPAATEDAYASLAWVSANAKELNVDASKLVVMGDSAGGLLSASTALFARDRQLSPPLAKQILIYPTLDDRVPDVSDDPRKDLMLWRAEDSVVIWNAYLGGGRAGKDDVDIPLNSVPARVANLEGLPPTYIDIGTLDLFLEENFSYAKRLLEAGVEVEMHVLPGLPHGWERAGEISWMKTATESRVSAIKRVL